MVDGAGPGAKLRAVKLVVPLSNPLAMVPVVQMPIGLGQPVVNVELISVLMLSHWLSPEAAIAAHEKRSSKTPMKRGLRCELIFLLLLMMSAPAPPSVSEDFRVPLSLLLRATRVARLPRS